MEHETNQTNCLIVFIKSLQLDLARNTHKMLAFLLHLYLKERNKSVKLIFSLMYSTFHYFLYYDITKSCHKCPQCFGDELCQLFHTKQIRLTFFSIILSIFNPNLSKSVFYGNLNEMEVVLKRMSPPADDGFHFFSKDWSNKTAHALVMISEKLMFQQEDETKNVVLCPAGADASLLFKHVDLDQLIEGKQFWLMTKVSIEPLLMQVCCHNLSCVAYNMKYQVMHLCLQAFSAEGTWPVPLYYGACGDLIVEEYRGNSLQQSFSLPWKARVFLSVQILRAADMFTFSHPELAFYFTDLSTDNLVVDSSGILTLVDLDNVIVVSKNMAKYCKCWLGFPNIIINK